MEKLDLIGLSDKSLKITTNINSANSLYAIKLDGNFSPLMVLMETRILSRPLKQPFTWQLVVDCEIFAQWLSQKLKSWESSRTSLTSQTLKSRPHCTAFARKDILEMWMKKMKNRNCVKQNTIINWKNKMIMWNRKKYQRMRNHTVHALKMTSYMIAFIWNIWLIRNVVSRVELTWSNCSLRTELILTYSQKVWTMLLSIGCASGETGVQQRYCWEWIVSIALSWRNPAS